MDALIIKGTDSSPAVVFDPMAGIFEISGESRPENAGKFYKPVLEWLENYFAFRYWKDNETANNGSTVSLEIKLDYFNSTSAKYILEIFNKFEKFKKENINVKVVWSYHEADTDMKESGEEFEEMTGLKFTYNLRND
jgi:hypothetical protein